MWALPHIRQKSKVWAHDLGQSPWRGDTSLVLSLGPLCLPSLLMHVPRKKVDWALSVVVFWPGNPRHFAFHGDVHGYSQWPHFFLLLPLNFFLPLVLCHQHFICPMWCLYCSFSVLSRLLAKCILPGRLHIPEAHTQQLWASRSYHEKEKHICFLKIK